MTTAPPPTTATTQSPTTPLVTLSHEIENNAVKVTLEGYTTATVSMVVLYVATILVFPPATVGRVGACGGGGGGGGGA